ncbi:unnamed protein product [Phytomonas sp. EM1]|nr:unnamed protein product [Phytomonas sp. EM1]|eukprot:CCW61765.1 unnamed protein product [Phytomonas sp. isolate EM1]
MFSVTFWSSSTGFVGINGVWENQLKLFANIFPSLGLWTAEEVSNPTQVAFFYNNETVRYQKVAETNSKHPCNSKSPSELCFVWSTRNWSTTSTTLLPLQGNVFVQPNEYEFNGVRRQHWTLLMHEGTMVDGQKAKFMFRGAWDNLSSTEGRWMGIGYSTRDSKMRSIRTWTNESDKDLYYRLTSKYFSGDLTSVEAAKLFNRVYDIEQKKQNTTNGAGKEDRDTGKNILTYTDVTDTSCVWLGEIAFGNSTGTVGHMWSTCGDAISWSSSMQSFRAWSRLTNWYAIGLLFLQAIPMLWGCWHQLQWIRHSRTYTLRVSLLQVLFLLFWTSFYGKAIQRFSVYMPLSWKLMRLIEVFSLFNQVLQWALLSSIYQEQMNYLNRSPNEFDNGLFQSLLIIQTGLLSWDLLSEYLTNAWFLGISLSLFWLPQVVHFFTSNGWAGLTTPFILGSASLGMVPMVLVLGWSPEPWELPKGAWNRLFLATVVLSLQTVILTTLRWKANRYILPHWLAPWRHRYVASLEIQNIALQETPLCPICRNNLREGWDESDELWRTPCNHFFHKSCLQRWMDESHNCPLCRRFLPEP